MTNELAPPYSYSDEPSLTKCMEDLEQFTRDHSTLHQVLASELRDNIGQQLTTYKLLLEVAYSQQETSGVAQQNIAILQGLIAQVLELSTQLSDSLM